MGFYFQMPFKYLRRFTLAVLLSFFSGSSLFASYLEPNIGKSQKAQPITYGFYVFSKTSDGSSGLSRVFLCLDDGTITLRCNVFDKSRVTLKSFPLFLEKTLKEPSFTLEKEPYGVLPYGEVWFTRRPSVAASTSLMAYAVKLSTRRPCVAASTSASADAEDLTTSGGCSNANFAPKYNSQELDKESQFYYFNARHYDPELARFVTADVMVDGERRDDETGLIISSPTYGWNRYMYVAGNPIMYKDPTGHFLDTIVDVASALYDIGSAVKNTIDYAKAEKGSKEEKQALDNLKEDAVALAADVAAAVVPGVTGAGAAVRVANKGKKALKNADEAAEAGSKLLGSKGTKGKLGKVILRNPISAHAAQQMATRNITPAMVRTTIRSGTRYFDRMHGTISHVLRTSNSKFLQVGTNPATGKVTTTILRSRFNPNVLFGKSPRFVPYK